MARFLRCNPKTYIFKLRLFLTKRGVYNARFCKNNDCLPKIKGWFPDNNQKLENPIPNRLGLPKRPKA